MGMRKFLLIIFICISASSFGQPLKMLLQKPGVVEVRVNFSLASVSVSTYNNLFGAPKTGVRSLTNMTDINGRATPWDITTVATANWRDTAFSVSATDGIAGVTAMSFLTGATSGVYANAYYNYGNSSPATYDASLHQFLISGLDPNRTYELKMTGMDGTYTFDCTNMQYRVEGATTPAAQEVSGDVTSQSNGATFTIQPNSSGEIKVWCNSIAGLSLLNMVAGMIIKQL